MFDCYETVHAVLQVTTGVMSTLKVRGLIHCCLKNTLLTGNHGYTVVADRNVKL